MAASRRRMTAAHLSGSAAILAAAFGILPNAHKERAWKGQIPLCGMGVAGASGFLWNGTCALDCGRMPQAADRMPTLRALMKP